MQISLSYPEVHPLDVPDANLLANLAPKTAAAAKPIRELVEKALDLPASSGRIEEMVSPSARVLILVDDITRQTPAAEILPPLLRRLESRGVGKKNIQFLIAAGTHARMTAPEIEKKLGATVPREYAVTLHHWKEEGTLQRIGATADGTPVRINALVGRADFVIGVGQIVPHRVMGFTGGATIIQPGVSGPEVTGYTHWQSALYAGREILGIAENPVRREVEQIARLAGLRFIINVVMDGRHAVTEVVAGDPVAAHRKGAAFSREIYGVTQSVYADIVVAESYPADYDLWQAAKGIYSSELAVREGGIVVLVTPCPHGVSDEHPEVEQLGYLGFEEVKAQVEKKLIRDLVAAAHLVHVGRVIRDRARGIMVSPGIKAETQRHLGLEPARTPQEALDKALAIVGRDAKVAVLHHGGDVLPIVQESEVRSQESGGGNRTVSSQA
ncbi:MAG: nickel-dependent lactate racemase [Acidobacteria bacterium]|nr:MAG: nickel-dependent lactate racemase [Acidobacteriota bacterium]